MISLIALKVKSQSPKLLTTAPSDQNEMDSSVRKFSDQQEIENAPVANIKESDIKELCAIDAE